MRGRKINMNRDESDIDMTPMLDIVFIMLIFFIVTASFLKEAGVDLNRPDSDTANEDNDKVSIIIDIAKDSQVWFQKRRIDVRAIRANLARQMAEMDDPSIVIRTHPSARTGTVIQVVDSVRSAGVENYVVATVKE